MVIPAFCTGWKAMHALAAGLPEEFRPKSLGSRFGL